MDLAKGISQNIEQMHLSTEMRYPLYYGESYGSWSNLRGCTDPVLLIHRVFAV